MTKAELIEALGRYQRATEGRDTVDASLASMVDVMLGQVTQIQSEAAFLKVGLEGLKSVLTAGVEEEEVQSVAP